MTEYHVHSISGQGHHFGDVINNPPPPTIDHVQIAASQLRARCYAEAADAYTRALRENPSDVSSRYGLALSLLDGRRPHRSRRDTIKAIARHLAAADVLPEARALHLLVNEDQDLAWQRWSGLPEDVQADLDLVEPQRAQEITEHVPAWEARVWRALRQRAEERE